MLEFGLGRRTGKFQRTDVRFEREVVPPDTQSKYVGTTNKEATSETGDLAKQWWQRGYGGDTVGSIQTGVR